MALLFWPFFLEGGQKFGQSFGVGCGVHQGVLRCIFGTFHWCFWVDSGWVVLFTHPVSQLGDLCLDEKVPVLGLHRELYERAIVQKLVLALSYFKS